MLEVEDRIQLEQRISKSERSIITLDDDIKEIKNSLRWIMGLIFSSNLALIGILARGFHLI